MVYSMKRHFLLFGLLIISQGLWAQLNCKTQKYSDLSSTKACLHSNGKISTKEFWDANKYWGRFEAYDPSGKSIINYELRRVAGHASVDVYYYANGQVSKIEFHSAPDGGIQFYHYVHIFDDKGIQTAYYDYSQPDGHPTTISPDLFKRDPVVTPKPKEEPEVSVCAAIAVTRYYLQNHTKAEVRLILSPSYQTQYPMRQARVLTIAPMSELLVDSLLMAEKFIELNTLFTLSADNTQKDRDTWMLIPQTIQVNPYRDHYWHIVTKIPKGTVKAKKSKK
jgi:hypothetical protein